MLVPGPGRDQWPEEGYGGGNYRVGCIGALLWEMGILGREEGWAKACYVMGSRSSSKYGCHPMGWRRMGIQAGKETRQRGLGRPLGSLAQSSQQSFYPEGDGATLELCKDLASHLEDR